MAREPSDWHVATNLNNTPDAQGTLFSGGTKYSSDKRYPKGFTPERRDAVAQAVVPPSGVYLGPKGIVRPDQTFSGNRNLRDFQFGDEKQHTRSKQGMRRAVETIARSTVPLEHLQPTPGSKGPLKMTVDESFHDGELKQRGNAGEYYVGGKSNGGVPSGQNELLVHTDYADSAVTIHEVGHHASGLLKNPHSGAMGGYRTAGTRGLEEGFADKYADEHYRNHQGKQETRGLYAGGVRDEVRTDSFYKQYHKSRGTDPAEIDNINAWSTRLNNMAADQKRDMDNDNASSLIKTGHNTRGFRTYHVNPEAHPPGQEPMVASRTHQVTFEQRAQAARISAPKYGDLQGDPSRAKMKP